MFMKEIEGELRRGDMLPLLKYSDERKNLEQTLYREFGLSRDRTKLKIGYWGISVGIDVPNVLSVYRHIWLQPHLRFIYNTSKSLATISALTPHFKRVFGRFEPSSDFW